jgi:hypothetical protein
VEIAAVRVHDHGDGKIADHQSPDGLALKVITSLVSRSP